MFVQQIDKLPHKTLADNTDHIVKKLKPSKYAAILHDQDVNDKGNPAEDHVHIVMQFKNARSLHNLAKLTSQPEQQFEKWNGEVNNAYSYIVHQTKNAQEKHQYKAKEVIANFDYIGLIKTISKEVDETTKLNDSIIINNTLDLLYDGEITLAEAEEMLTGSQYGKAKSKLDAVYKKTIEKKAEQWRKEMREKKQSSKVLWLYGTSSTGKTKLARKYAKEFSNSFYFSGSTRDPFQRYEGQHVIILDELRPKSMDYSDLLKMIDPFNDESMAPSRYFDRPITANYFIVTSPYSPEDFYDGFASKGDIKTWIDTFDQLARRLFLVQKMTQTQMSLYFYDDEKKYFIEDESTVTTNPYAKKTVQETEKKQEAMDLFNKLAETGLNPNKEEDVKK